MDNKILKLKKRIRGNKEAVLEIDIAISNIKQSIDFLEMYRIPTEHVENLKFTLNRLKDDLIQAGIL